VEPLRERVLGKPQIVGGLASADGTHGALTIKMDRSSTDPPEEIQLDPEKGNDLENLYPQATDAKIEEIYALVEDALQKGQPYVPVHSFPFKMTEENMALYADSKWYDFWVNLKEGYDYFEAEKIPAHIIVKDKKYIILEAND